MRPANAKPLRLVLFGALAAWVTCTALALALTASAASALVQRPTTVDGPAAAILDFGGVAMAPDGTGGLVYTKAVEGVPHVFASRYDGSHWSAPIRVDREQAFEGGQPRIAADSDGRLLVVWVTPVATYHSQIQRALLSATLGPEAGGFGSSTIVDPNVGNGAGADPALAGVASGKAIVAYRVITNDFSSGSNATVAQLRPGDVLADVRVARLNGERWSRLGAVNRNPAASMRAPSSLNAPQVGIGAGGNAVVAWQEPDQSGAARIWVRRVFGNTLGPPIEASPASWEGAPVAGDANAFSLAVTAFDQARIVSRVGSGGALSAPRLFLGSLAPSYQEGGAKLIGPQPADLAGTSPSSGPLGPPAVTASGEGGGEGSMRLAFLAGGSVRQVGVGPSGALAALPQLNSPVAQASGEVVATVDTEGGGATAYSAVDSLGRPVVAVRQEFPSGGAQLGLISGVDGGPVSELDAGRTGHGDSLIGFRQGEPGGFEIVAERVSAPPASFQLSAPDHWVRPQAALLRWQPAPSTVGGVTYSVVVGGRLVGANLRQRRFRPRPAMLGSGTRRVRVIATDAVGGQVLTRPVKLRVDGEAPTATVRSRGLLAVVRLRDPDSGLAAASCSFGAGWVAAKGSCRFRYPAPGRYTVVVKERDEAGNRVTRRLTVRAR